MSSWREPEITQPSQGKESQSQVKSETFGEQGQGNTGLHFRAILQISDTRDTDVAAQQIFFYQSETSVQLILKRNNRSTTFTLLTRGARSCARQKLPLQCLTLQDVKAVPLATQITDPLASIIAALVALTISHRPLCAFKILRVDFQEGKRKGRQRSPKVPSPFLSQAYRLTPTGWASFLTPLVATTELSKFLGKVFSQCNRSFILLLVREHNQVFPPGFAFQRQKHVTMS